MFTFRALFLWIHVVTVVCWIGGIIFSSFIAGPVLNGKSGMPGGFVYHERIVHRFQRLSRELLFVILLTGIFNLVNRGILVSFNFSSAYLMVLGTKFTALLCIAALQVYYSMKLMPRLSKALQAKESEEEAVDAQRIARLRKQAFWLAGVMTALGVSAIFMGLNLGAI